MLAAAAQQQQQRHALLSSSSRRRRAPARPAAAAAAAGASAAAQLATAAAAAARRAAGGGGISPAALPPPRLAAALAAALAPAAAARAAAHRARPALHRAATASGGAASAPFSGDGANGGDDNSNAPGAGLPGGARAPARGLVPFLSAFWKFLRPHTIRGTILGTTALTARALLEAPAGSLDWGLLPKALAGLFALLCGNGFIVGINQIYDVSIDAINKPFLPVAAGELSPGVAWLLCGLLAAAGGATTASLFGPLISSLYACGLFLGTVYSVPPLRLKRFAVPAFLIIATVRGALLNFGVYYATRSALALPFEWSPAVAFITAFVTLFATVIAVTKDLPDVEGDRANGVSTFATRLGVPRVAGASVAALMLGYAGAAAWGLARPEAFAYGGRVMVGAHAALASVLAARFSALAREGFSRGGVASFYRWIWTLFYSEYALLCFL